MSGRIILFEGMDGSGKSTLVKAVEAHLHSEEGGYYRAKTFAFPSLNGALGSFIREEIFTKSIELESQQAMLHLMLADAYDQDENVASWRQDFDWVLLDRHGMVSAWAYQAPDHTVATVAAVTDPNLFEAAPDVIFILDVPAEVALERRAQRNLEPNPLFEKDLAHAEQLRSRYAAYAGMYTNTGPVVLLDGTLPVPELLGQVLQVLDGLD